MAEQVEWACPRCTFKNPATNINCTICCDGHQLTFGTLYGEEDYRQPSPPADRSLFSLIRGKFKSPTWECRECGSVNRNSLSHCSNCTRRRERRKRTSDGSSFFSRLFRRDSWKPDRVDDTSQQKSDVDARKNPSRSVQHQITSVQDHDSELPEIHRGSPCPTIEGASLERDPFEEDSFSSIRPQVYQSLSVNERRRNEEDDAQKQWRAIVEMQRKLGDAFVDCDFQHKDSSLYMRDTATRDHHWRVHQWLRPHQIQDLEHNHVNWTVYRTPRPSDICQGALGNCWLLSALALVAEKQELVQQIVVTKDYCPEGVYQARLCKNGQWTIVTVDDYFPCSADGCLVFSQARRKQLWVPLIEKCVAKLFGSYESLHSGTIEEGISLLTGAASEEIEICKRDTEGVVTVSIDLEVLWAKLLSFKEIGFVVAAACGQPEDDDRMEQMYRGLGLLTSHAYSVLDVRTFHLDGNRDKPIRLIRLRNPWGRFSWKGEWSDDSPLWDGYPHLKEELMPLGNEEGIFWMLFEDFIKYFSRIVVCKYRPDWFTSSIHDQLLPPGKLKAMFITVHKPTEVDICLYQRSNRGLGDFMQSWNLWILVVRCATPPQPNFDLLLSCSDPREPVLHSKCSCKEVMSCSGWLEPGHYVILPLSFLAWTNNGGELLGNQHDQQTSIDYHLTVFSSRILPVDKVALRPGFVSKSLFMLVKTFGEKKELTVFVKVYTLSIPRLMKIAVAENGANSHFIVNSDAANSYNVLSTRGQLETCDCIPPNHWQILWVLSRALDTVAYSLVLQSDFHLTPNRMGGGWGALHQPPYPLHLQELHQVYPIE